MLRDANPSDFAGIYIVCGRTDMRLGIDSLAAIIENRYHLPLFVPNTLFLFCGRRANKIKGLLWEGDGFLLLTKRVEDGHFSWPRNSSEARRLDARQFDWLMKRSFAEYVKATGTEGMDGTVAAQAVNLISEIFHLDHQCGDCTIIKREKHRQLVVKPKVDAFFAWIKETLPKVSAGSNTYKSLQYCINQEKFLRVFLSNGAVPMDNILVYYHLLRLDIE